MAPPTFKFSAIPTPPSTMSAPVVELVEVVVLFRLVSPVTSRVPPTLRFSATPTPPVTLRAPVVLDVDVVLLLNVTTPSELIAAILVDPVTSKAPPTLRFSTTPTPPVTLRAPVVLDVDVVLLLNVTTPSEVIAAIVVAPVTSMVPPTFKFSAIPTPPVTLRAPVVLDVDVVLSLNVTTPSEFIAAILVDPVTSMAPPTVKSPDVFTTPVPLASIFKSTLASSPEAEIVGPFPVAALVTVISLTALAVAVPLTNSFPFESRMFPMRFPVTLLKVTLSAVPNPKVVLAVAASASSISVPPKVETLAAGKALSAVVPCAAVA